ncbi:hypothetical protein VTN77DRAFT_3824 [Rasamsonia byssochlamydoides]|uniref:uncharacterized protein n=1 Tax=Rasamsonia byssochlamydoides TaxID=89139 RepID=UPI0037439774
MLLPSINVFMLISASCFSTSNQRFFRLQSRRQSMTVACRIIASASAHSVRSVINPFFLHRLLTRMRLRLRNILPRLRLLLMVDPIPCITLRQQRLALSRMGRLLRDQTAHQLGLVQGHLVAAIDLSEVVRLAVEADDVPHRGRLGGRPDCPRRAQRRGHDQHAALDLVDVRVPQLALLLGQGVVDLRRDHVLDAKRRALASWVS